MPRPVAIYDGFVSIDEGRVHVVLGIVDDRISLSSNGSEIGQWDRADVSLVYVGGGVYTINVEGDTLRFVPSDQDLFAIEFGEIEAPGQENRPEDVSGRHARRAPGSDDEDGPRTAQAEAPPPRAATRVAFYALVATTALLGLWALLSMTLG